MNLVSLIPTTYIRSDVTNDLGPDFQKILGKTYDKSDLGKS